MMKLIDKIYLKILLICWCMSMLTACGFHLRGTNFNLSSFGNVYVQSNQPFSTLTQTIKQELTDAHIRLAASPKNAKKIIALERNNFSQQLLMISSTTQARIYQLNYTLNYKVLDRNNRILANRTITTSTTFRSSDNQLLADNSQLNQQKQFLEQQIANELLLQLSTMPQ